MSENNNKPSGWITATIRDCVANESHAIVDGPFGTQMKVHEFVSSGIPLIEMQNIDEDNFVSTFRRFITKNKFEEVKRSAVKGGDVLISKTGSLGYVAIVPEGIKQAMITSRLAKISIDWRVVDRKFLLEYLLFLREKGYWLRIAKGTTMKILNVGQLAETEIPLPPLTEQHRIVVKIEELFSSLDKGIESLKTAQQQLKVYRQAVLKWAFEGKLTNNNVVEGELPAGWKWVNIDYFLSNKKKGMATGPFGTMLKKSEHQNSGVPVLGIENIGEGVFQMPNKIFVTNEKAKELENFRVKEDDIIISRSGTVGEICSVPMMLGGSIISTNLIKVSINQEVLSPKYFVYLFQGGKVRQQVFNLCKGSSRAFLNQTILEALNFPYCPLPEQQLVVAEIESRLSVCDKMEEIIEQSLQQSEALRQSILKKAFEGKLVPQDRNDESASVLLERIKAEREKNRLENSLCQQAGKTRAKRAKS